MESLESRDERAPLLGVSEDRLPGGMTWVTAAATMVAQMVGIGMLSVPVATAQSGWVGAGLLVLCALLTWISANLLGAVMKRTRRGVRDYASVGQFAMGRVGKWAGGFGQYSLLVGASVSFIILMGNLMHGLVCVVPKRIWSMVFALIALLIILAIPALKKAKPVAIFAVATMWSAVLLIVGLSAYFLASKTCEGAVCEATCATDVALASIGGGFSVYTFAFSVHASIPNFFAEMAAPSEVGKSFVLAYGGALLLFGLPLLITTYAAFGRGLLDPAVLAGSVVDALTLFGPSSFGPAVVAVKAVLIAHLLTALPIILTPIALALERGLLKGHVAGTRTLRSAAVRVAMVATICLVAIVLPYFLPVLSIVSDISVVLVIYVLPPLFFWNVESGLVQPRSKRYALRAGLLLLMAFGLAGSALGLKVAIPALVRAIETGGNPFQDFFLFQCPNSTLSAALNYSCSA